MNGYDLHTHTEYSFDCRTSLKDLATAVIASGLSGVAITDHDTLEGALRLRDMNPPFDVIVGCEFTLENGRHLIGLYLHAPIRATTLPETAAAIHAQGGVVVMPHPYRSSTGLLGESESSHYVAECLPHIDLIEVFNAKSCYEENHKAMALARQWRKRATAGSDAHRAARIGSGRINADGSALTPDRLRTGALRISGVNQSGRGAQVVRQRREAIRRLALRFQRVVPDSLWQWGKEHWDQRCDTVDFHLPPSDCDYGSFPSSHESDTADNRATCRQE